MRRLIGRIPGVRRARSFFRALQPWNPFLRFAPPGHFYSPLPDPREIRRDRERLFDRSRAAIPGIRLDPERQLALVRELSAYAGGTPYPATRTTGRRYFYENEWFGHGSAVVLYCMLRHLRPARDFEIGSGFSSAAMLDANDLDFGGRIAFTFVEPNPARLYELLTAEDRRRHEVVVDAVQHVPLDRYDALGPGDLLFVDSSHVARIGSDVGHLLTEVLPRLKPGVVVHFHDVYWPFEYPEKWVLDGCAWNEAYVLRAFLQFNESFEILLFNSYLSEHHRERVAQALPGFIPKSGSSLWLRSRGGPSLP
jgi:predicted O-methyltransferase YrrM